MINTILLLQIGKQLLNICHLKVAAFQGPIVKSMSNASDVKAFNEQYVSESVILEWSFSHRPSHCLILFLSINVYYHFITIFCISLCLEVHS